MDVYQWLDRTISQEDWSQEQIDLWFEKWGALADLGKELHAHIISISDPV
jgi:hypothetical protein